MTAARTLPRLLLAAVSLAACTAPNDRYQRTAVTDARSELVTDLGSDPAPSPPDSAMDAGEETPSLDGPRLDGGGDGLLDGAPDGAPDLTPDLLAADLAPDLRPDTAPANCGTRKADLTNVDEADGVAIASDGTLYFSTTDDVDGWIGRIPPGGMARRDWVRVAGARANWGLALSPDDRNLYLASVSQSTIFELNISTMVLRPYVSIVEPNDLVFGPDGALYVSSQIEGFVYRVTGLNQRAAISSTRFGSDAAGQAPSALAVGVDRALYVGLRSGGSIYRVTLAAGRETGRAAFGSWTGWANGMAFDSLGRLYVGVYSSTVASRLELVDGSGNNKLEKLAGGQFAGMAFGRGMLDCNDLYLADPTGPMRRLGTDAPGLPP